jgi:prepilin-type N-terminal cleavage/methylation domain-containing protein
MNIRWTGKRGFTLVEMMVVVAILAVLMAIVVPAVGGTREQSVEGQVKGDADAVGKAASNFNNKSITPRFPEQSLAAHSSASGVYADILTIGGGTNGSKVNLYKGGAEFGAETLDGTTGLRSCTAGAGDQPDCEALSAQISRPGGGGSVDKRTVVNYFARTDIYDADGSVKTVGFVPDFISKVPSSLTLRAEETKNLGSAGNTIEEYVWLMVVNAPGSSQESRSVQVFRVIEALCDGADANSVATSGECGSLSALSEVKQLNLVRAF